MQVVNNLLNFKDMKIVQNTEWFAFSIDSVLLSNFVTLNKTTNKIIDFCTGNAPIPLILSTKTNSNIIGVELQKEIFELACLSISENKLQKQIQIINEDVANLTNLFESDVFDVITCNPPYFKIFKNSNLNKNDIKSIARHELNINLSVIFKTAKKILKNKGIIAMVHRPDRLLEVLEEMKINNIEPKKIQFVYPKMEMESNIVLIEGSKNGNPGLKILKPIFIHDKNGNYSKEIKDMFE